MAKYQLHITSSDTFGMAWLQTIIDCANMGATMTPGTIPMTRFPHHITMDLETETPPNPTATLRVFEVGGVEVFAANAVTKAATFSMESEEDEVVIGEPLTKEQLDALDWETEFKEVCKSVGVTGRSRDKMTKEYLAKFA